MRALHWIGGAMSLCALAVVWAVGRAFEFVLAAIPPTPGLIFSGEQLAPNSTVLTFRDPRVDRHEAGASRRAAARHI